MYKYGQELPEEVEKRVDAYIEQIKAIKWFQPAKDLKKEDVEKQVHVALKAFGVEASIEYKKLKTNDDWVAARDAVWDAAWVAARGAVEELVCDLPQYKQKRPNGVAFQTLIPLWEMGLYPIGVVNGKFLIYIPASKQEFPTDFE